MSYLTNADLESFEELDDAELATVIGGGTVDSLIGTVTGFNSALGNDSQLTSRALNLTGVTLVNAGLYVIDVSRGAESGLQALNGGLADVGDSV